MVCLYAAGCRALPVVHRPARAVRVRDTFAASAYALYVGTCYVGDAVDTAEFSSLDGSARCAITAFWGAELRRATFRDDGGIQQHPA